MKSEMRHQQVGYIRVSTREQNTARQLDNMRLDKVFTDTCSGRDTHRPALRDMISYVRAVDTVHVHDISRLARNVADLIEIIKKLNSKGVSVKFHKENLFFSSDESNPMSELMLNLLGAVYQFERSMLLERQREGIIRAQAEGRYKGKPKTVDRAMVLEKRDCGLSIRSIANELKLSPTTVHKILHETN